MVFMFLTVLFLSFSTQSEGSQFAGTFSPTQLTASQIKNILSDHNFARATQASPAASIMPNLLWDNSLAEVTQTYLNTLDCAGIKAGTVAFQHNGDRTDWHTQVCASNASCPFPDTYVGENWASIAPDNVTDKFFGGAIKLWTTGNCGWVSTSSTGAVTCESFHCSEYDNFYGKPVPNGTGNCINGVTGHFTQVLWAGTKYMGCGYRDGCGTLCDYLPGGNDAPLFILNPPIPVNVTSCVLSGKYADTCWTPAPTLATVTCTLPVLTTVKVGQTITLKGAVHSPSLSATGIMNWFSNNAPFNSSSHSPLVSAGAKLATSVWTWAYKHTGTFSITCKYPGATSKFGKCNCPVRTITVVA